MTYQRVASRILVMGPTGSGKSTFINLASGSTLSVSGGLKSCTFEVLESKPFVLEGEHVILVDTPGFDDTTRSDTDIMSTIARYLADTHRQGIRLRGVIYMHRISDVRISGTSLLNFRIFHNMCGDDGLQNALIATTMWSGVEHALGESRERELETAEDLFKPVLDRGARLVRHDGTLSSAQAILRHLIANSDTTLRIQRELVDEGKELVDTTAGAELARLFTEQAGRLEERSKKLQTEIRDGWQVISPRDQAMLRLELDETHKKKKHVENEAERLRRILFSAIDFDLVQRLSGASAEHLCAGKLSFDRDSQAWFPTPPYAKTVPATQERPNESEMTKKENRNENERLYADACKVLEVLKSLKSRNIELYEFALRTEPTRQYKKPFGKRADRTLDEIQAMQQELDVAIRIQNKLATELRKSQEGAGWSICDWAIRGLFY